MTNRSNDDIADALGKLAGGEHAEPSEHVPSGQANVFPSPAAPSPPPPAAPGRPAPAPPPGPVIHKPTATPSARPRPQPRVNSPPAATPTAPQPASARPGRPSQPIPSSPPPPRPVAPASPSAPAYQPPAAPAATSSSSYITDDVETTGIQPVDEDDAVIVPAAPLSALGFRPHAGPSASVAAARALDRRRTIIPVLLTAGLLLLATAVLRFVAHPDSPLASLPAWIPFVLVLVAAVILGVAGLNMAQVRQHLRNTPTAPAGR